jgi:hypothetical protein
MSKKSRMGNKQKHGHSRSAYAALAKARLPANKAKKIEKDKRDKARAVKKNEARKAKKKPMRGDARRKARRTIGKVHDFRSKEGVQGSTA